MGVTDLNKLIATGKPVKRDDYEYVIIDMSNMLITYLFRWYARLPTAEEIEFENYTVKIPGGKLIIENINEVMLQLKEGVLTDVMSVVGKLKTYYSNLKSVILVSDPTTVYKYQYIYNNDIHMHCVDNDLFNEWIKFNNHEIEDYDNISIDFSSKEEERATRIKSQMVEKPIQIVNKNGDVVVTINDYNELATDPEDNELKHIYHVLYTCTYFMKRSRLMKLMSYIQDAIINYTESNDLLEYYFSKGEADIFIKAYYYKFIDDKASTHRTLVMSNDTDYFMLFADTPLVDTVKISPFNPNDVYNPSEFWSSLLSINPSKTSLMRCIIARISALFGNDYTCHQRKLVADPKVIPALRCFFDIDEYDDVHDITMSAASLTYKLRANIDTIHEEIDKMVQELYSKYENDPSISKYRTYEYSRMFKFIDSAIVYDAVKRNDPRFFNGYYETLLIYTNFRTYDEYTNMKGKVLSDDLKKRIKNENRYEIDFVRQCKETSLIE